MTETYERPDLGPDQQYALTSAVRSLGEQFAGAADDVVVPQSVEAHG